MRPCQANVVMLLCSQVSYRKPTALETFCGRLVRSRCLRSHKNKVEVNCEVTERMATTNTIIMGQLRRFKLLVHCDDRFKLSIGHSHTSACKCPEHKFMGRNTYRGTKRRLVHYWNIVRLIFLEHQQEPYRPISAIL